MFTPSIYQQNILQWNIQNKGLHKALAVISVAGSGKSSTLEYLIRESGGYSLMLAFNKEIQTSFQERATRNGLNNVVCKTMNAYGFGLLRQVSRSMIVDKDKTSKIALRFLSREDHKLATIVQNICSKIKNTLSETDNESLMNLCADYSIQYDAEYENYLFDVVRKVMIVNNEDLRNVDFDDQIFLPVIHNIYDNFANFSDICNDECQDDNNLQIEFLKMIAGENTNMTFVGDPYQSIYAFRGANPNSVDNIVEQFHADKLPLSISYRCPRVIGDYVNKNFPKIQFSVSDNAIDGNINQIKDTQFQPEYGDMCLARTNAPLVFHCLAQIRQGKKAYIRGRDIGENIMNLVKKQKADSISTLIDKLMNWKEKETLKAEKTHNDSRAQTISDQFETVLALSDGMTTIQELNNRIDSIFQANAPGILFSTVHKAKGLEAKHVHILCPELMPHPMAKKSVDIEQEKNIEYVAVTRTLDKLTFVENTLLKKQKRD